MQGKSRKMVETAPNTFKQVSVRIPKRFYDDCVNCETRTPPIIGEYKRFYVIDTSEPDPGYPGETAEQTMADFVSRAKYYSDPVGFEREVMPIVQSAKATLATLNALGFGEDRYRGVEF